MYKRFTGGLLKLLHVPYRYVLFHISSRNNFRCAFSVPNCLTYCNTLARSTWNPFKIPSNIISVDLSSLSMVFVPCMIRSNDNNSSNILLEGHASAFFCNTVAYAVANDWFFRSIIQAIATVGANEIPDSQCINTRLFAFAVKAREIKSDAVPLKAAVLSFLSNIRINV